MYTPCPTSTLIHSCNFLSCLYIIIQSTQPLDLCSRTSSEAYLGLLLSQLGSWPWGTQCTEGCTFQSSRTNSRWDYILSTPHQLISIVYLLNQLYVLSSILMHGFWGWCKLIPDPLFHVFYRPSSQSYSYLFSQFTCLSPSGLPCLHFLMT